MPLLSIIQFQLELMMLINNHDDLSSQKSRYKGSGTFISKIYLYVSSVSIYAYVIHPKAGE